MKERAELKAEIEPIAYIETDFGSKFGIPRQARLAEELRGRIVFTEKYRSREALRGIEGYSHIWLIWQFSENAGKEWSPTVRPPRLGGNVRMGVWATRSPFRPNSLGLSCVRLGSIEDTENGPVLNVLGADLMNGTPIFDIKPYIPYTDCVPEAAEGFAPAPDYPLSVVFEGETEKALPAEKRQGLEKALMCDPRPHYQDDPGRMYGMSFAGKNVRFYVDGTTAHVTEIGEEN